MCYSAQMTAAYQKLVRMTGATLSLREFAALYAHDPGKKRPKTPKAMDDAFRAGASPARSAKGARARAHAAGLKFMSATSFPPAMSQKDASFSTGLCGNHRFVPKSRKIPLPASFAP